MSPIYGRCQQFYLDSLSTKYKKEIRLENIIERPRICCVDLSTSDLAVLESNKFNLFNGTLGSLINVPNKRSGHAVHLMLDFSFPENFHEYDILIVDLINETTKEYTQKDDTIQQTRAKATYKMVCRYPTTTFDPRPISTTILAQNIQKVHKRPFIQIIFACKNYSIEYETVKITDEYPQYLPIQKNSIYDFIHIPLQSSVAGKEIKICENIKEFKPVLEKYLNNTSYEQTFYHPKNYSDSKSNPDFTPLLKNINDEIISFVWTDGNLTTIVLPNIENKGLLINDLLTNTLPALVPSVFPYSTEFSWRDDKSYYLPNQIDLLNEQKTIHIEYEKKLIENEEKIIENYKKYQFLHELLTETGDNLVQAVYKYLKWLEFKDVKIQDEHSSSVLEEDLQVKLDNGLLIVETKGIGGTSTDSDCSQISKIKHRRCKERKAFDVFAIYIVNHQRFLPPLDRKNPPFTKEQLSDAENDERGLLSTWQLFTLYFDIQSGLITKDEARKELLKFGLVQFKPKTRTQLPMPKQILKDGQVVILDILNENLKVGQTLILEKNDRFTKTKIESIQVDGKSATDVTKGEVGLKLNDKVSKGTIIWTV